MMYDTHVYLGPSLDLKTAKTLLPEANYHPPIQCGDILQLLRLKPKKIIIIDGLYEVVPAVWHKEILIAIELGIEVWGAASMGALRAAELYQYGMKGYGDVYHDFKTNKLTDDDEVAVLHRGQEEDYLPIHDAMVNIRATCEMAFHQGFISAQETNDVVNYCKTQFYPYRTLRHCAIKLGVHHLVTWIDKHGIIDVKRQDAMGVLRHNAKLSTPDLVDDNRIRSHLTIFIRELSASVDVAPFRAKVDWLPEIEKKLQYLHDSMPQQYMLVAELAYFYKKLSIVAGREYHGDTSELLAYIKSNQLLSLEFIFACCSDMQEFQAAYHQICQVICEKKLTESLIERYLPVIAHYYDLDHCFAKKNELLLKALLTLMISINTIVYRTRMKISDDAVIHHCQELKRRRNYTQDQFQDWFHSPHIERKLFMNFIAHYFVTLRGSFYHHSQGFVVHPWIYDAYAFYQNHVEVNMLTCA